jgi:branched-chain amino acid transport system substrate-binding protein
LICFPIGLSSWQKLAQTGIATTREEFMSKRSVLLACVVSAALTAPAFAQDTVKIGLITALTGPFTTTGQEMQAAAKLYMQHHGNTVAGKKIELIIKDDGGVPDNSKRLAQELIVNDKVHFIAGMTLTPIALAIAPLVTEAKVPLVNMGAATGFIPSRSPYIVRTSFSLPTGIAVFGDWAAKQGGIKSVVTLVSDYAPGIDTETWFKKSFEAAGGKVLESMRIPLANPDFAPFLQRAADKKPDALFIFVPSGQGSSLMRQFVERGLDKSGIKLLATGDVLDDQLIDNIGDVALGLVSAYHYSDAHPSELNKKFSAGMEKTGGIRANMMGVGAYDGMALIYKALEKTKGDTDGTKLVEAMKGMAWESPRGPISIDPNTRDIVQNIYLRKVEKKNGRLQNVEFQTFPAPKDPSK